MITNNPLAINSNWHQQAYQCLLEKNYIQAVSLYEQAVIAEPEVKSHYWHLGLILLLQGQEAEAQTTWLFGMAEGEAEEVEQWTQELIQVLETEAERQRLELKDYAVAWAIRQHIREINPANINNLLHLIGLYIWLKTYTGKEPTELGLIDLLKEKSAIVDSELLLQVIKSVLDCAPLVSSSLDLTEASLVHIQDSRLFIEQLLLPLVYKISYSSRRPGIAAKFTELGLQLLPQDPELVCCIAAFYQDNFQFDQGIKSAKECFSLRTKLAEKVFANHLIMRGLMSAGGYWEEFCATIEQQKLLLSALLKEQPTNLSESTTNGLFNTVFFFPYFEDSPKENTQLRSKISKLAQLNIEIYAQQYIEKYQNRPITQINKISADRRLKIGYISHCFRSHSVGWLARSLFQHHDRERFEIQGYFISYDHYTYNPMQDWYVNQVEKAHKLGLTSLEAAEKIYENEIDILVDLDSMTLTTTCEVMALKPAPIQVTWLGWDASGLPAMDYFIGDPYVLPEDAQDYYSEKIWRLPQTYLAIDGFEVGLPTLRREQLNIPSDAVIYFSSQRGFKYNPNTVRLQMQIIKKVPNSYFLIKGVGDEESLKNFFIQFAKAEGVHPEQLRFLPLAISEQIHRANLAIADIVLDTYPYNGATTTMETLWMGIPMVTKVGQQFAARNSYTMMLNAGITEGIAWTDEEYVDWGIKLGTDEKLRQQVAWKLRQNRKTAPLWNAKQFTREMEKAYEQMWQKYIESKN